MSKLTVRELPLSEQPRYRAGQHGIEALSVAELLQLVCRNRHLDSNYELVSQAHGLRDLAQMSTEQIAQVDGIGEGIALSIKAAFELGRRAQLESQPKKVSLRSPGDVATILQTEIGDKTQEHFMVLLLNTRNQVIGTHLLYIGTKNSINVAPNEVFRAAIRRNATSIVIGHNHPSGDPTPSPEDVTLTRIVKKAADILDIELLDHIIVSPNKFVSLRERGLGFTD
jgi:DNA repair protein RadC